MSASNVGAPKRPAITINDDARAAVIVERIRCRCPELTAADLLLVARVINAAQQGKEGPGRSGPRAGGAKLSRRRAPP